jgi:hypothetical protein
MGSLGIKQELDTEKAVTSESILNKSDVIVGNLPLKIYWLLSLL